MVIGCLLLLLQYWSRRNEKDGVVIESSPWELDVMHSQAIRTRGVRVRATERL